MSVLRPAAAAAIGLMLSTVAAAADDYPFSGFFVYPPDKAEPADATLFCGYNFFEQGADGSYRNYHLDLPAYQKDGTVRFLLYTRGACTAENGRVETCRPSWDADKSLPSQDFVDVIKEIQPQTVAVSFFDGIAQARSYFATGKPLPTGGTTYYRCPYDAAAIAKYRSTAESTLTAVERDKLVIPDLDEQTRANMKAVLATIAAGK